MADYEIEEELNYTVNPCLPHWLHNREPSKLELFSCWYGNYHGYVGMIVCMFGILANILNIVILTKKNMQTSTNCILTGLAVSDLLTMSSYLPFAYHFYVMYPGPVTNPDKNAFGWMAFMMFNALFTATTHTVSIWIGVVLAIFRYIYVRLSTEGYITCSMPRAKIAVITVYLCSIIICIPNYCSLTLEEMIDKKTNRTFYMLKSINKTNEASHTLMNINLWTYAILAKIVPCILMSIFGGILLFTLQIAKRKGRLLHKHNRVSDSFRNRMREHSRTTRMLVAVILLFLVTELPQGVLLVISIMKSSFFLEVYTPLGDLMDAFALINNSINFILYCSMSKSFRDHFIDIICCFCQYQKKKPYLLGKRSRGTESIL
jgi:hypothetical protein